LGVNTPGESLEDGTQVNRLKRELDYLAGFKDFSNTTKRLRQANNYGSIVSNFGISRKRRRDSEDENIRQDSIRANKYQRNENKLVSRLRIFRDTGVQTKQKLAKLISNIEVYLANAKAVAKNF